MSEQIEKRRNHARKQLQEFYHLYCNNHADLLYVGLTRSIRKADEVELERIISEMEDRNGKAIMQKMERAFS